MEAEEVDHNRSAIPGLEEVQRDDHNFSTSQPTDNQLEKDQEALPQDLSMISDIRNSDR